MQIFRKTLGFIAVNLVFGIVGQFLLMQPTVFKIKMDEFHEDQYDSVIIGTSWAMDALNPRYLSGGSNGKVFNLAQFGGAVDQYGSLLQDAIESSNIKRVYLDLCIEVWEDSWISKQNDDPQFNVITSLLPQVRPYYIANVLINQNYNNFLFPYSISGESLSNLKKNMRFKVMRSQHMLTNADAINSLQKSEKFNYTGLGFLSINQHFDAEKDTKLVPRVFSVDMISEDAVEDFRKFSQMCREKDIELICIMSALPPERLLEENHDVLHNFYQNLCDSEHVKLYDMNYLKWEYFPRKAEDYYDSNGHMTGELAARYSVLVNKIVNSEDSTEYFESDLQTVRNKIIKSNAAA